MSMSVTDLTGEPLPDPCSSWAVRTLLALVLGAMIGVERQWHHKSAGIRTHALLALGAGRVRADLAPHHLAESRDQPTQIAAGVVTGIGFICGGVIMHRGISVQGLNTAASLWTTAGVGLAIGLGLYLLAYVMLAAVLTVQFPFVWIESWIDHRIASPLARSAWQVKLRGSRVTVERLWTHCTGGAGTGADVRRVSSRPAATRWSSGPTSRCPRSIPRESMSHQRIERWSDGRPLHAGGGGLRGREMNERHQRDLAVRCLNRRAP